MENKITAICQECNKQFEYNLKKGFPRKYCFECSEIKKTSYENAQIPDSVLNKSEKEAEDKVITRSESVPYFNENMIMAATKGGNGKSYPKDPVGLAVEIFVSLMGIVPSMETEIKTMERSIKLVKQAQKSFE